MGYNANDYGEWLREAKEEAERYRTPLPVNESHPVYAALKAYFNDNYKPGEAVVAVLKYISMYDDIPDSDF